nr:hypothetical transcript [Hymenolepis microstoma]
MQFQQKLSQLKSHASSSGIRECQHTQKVERTESQKALESQEVRFENSTKPIISTLGAKAEPPQVPISQMVESSVNKCPPVFLRLPPLFENTEGKTTQYSTNNMNYQQGISGAPPNIAPTLCPHTIYRMIPSPIGSHKLYAPVTCQPYFAQGPMGFQPIVWRYGPPQTMTYSEPAKEKKLEKRKSSTKSRSTSEKSKEESKKHARPQAIPTIRQYYVPNPRFVREAKTGTIEEVIANLAGLNVSKPQNIIKCGNTTLFLRRIRVPKTAIVQDSNRNINAFLLNKVNKTMPDKKQYVVYKRRNTTDGRKSASCVKLH